MAILPGTGLPAGKARPVTDPATEPAAEEAKSPESATTTAIEPKPLSETAQKGIKYLINQQDESGGWGQGGGWRLSGKGGGRVQGEQAKDRPDVANTCMATLALIRSGSTPTKGPYAKNVIKAVEYLASEIENSDYE